MTKKEWEKQKKNLYILSTLCLFCVCIPMNLLSVYYKWNELNAWNETKITNKPRPNKEKSNTREIRKIKMFPFGKTFFILNHFKWTQKGWVWVFKSFNLFPLHSLLKGERWILIKLKVLLADFWFFFCFLNGGYVYGPVEWGKN